MIKRFCDVCGVEITEKNKVDGDGSRLTGELKLRRDNGVVLSVEVITGSGSTWNDGDFCKYCVIDAINQADDRTKIKA